MLSSFDCSVIWINFICLSLVLNQLQMLLDLQNLTILLKDFIHI